MTHCCGCTAETRCVKARTLNDAYHNATTLAQRIEIGQAYTHHLRLAHLLAPLADARPLGLQAWKDEDQEVTP